MMRAGLTQMLTNSDAYYYFHTHAGTWYELWENRRVGQALEAPRLAEATETDGTYRREYGGGTVIHNPLGNGERTVVFDRVRERLSTGEFARVFTVREEDGDVFLHRSE